MTLPGYVSHMTVVSPHDINMRTRPQLDIKSKNARDRTLMVEPPS